VATGDIRERLAQLPRRAVVAFAARCARRVQPLTHALPQQGRDAIDRAIASAEAFAKDDSRAADAAEAAARAARADEAARAAHLAARAAHLAATAALATTDADVLAAAAEAAARAATVEAAADAEADDNDWADAWAAASSDLDRLIASNLGKPDTLGATIDPSESGPLGPLWPQGEPEWYTKAATGTVTPREEPSGDAELVVEIDVPEGLSDDEVLAVIKRLSLEADDLHRALGGHGLKVKRLEVYQGTPAPVEVPLG
jgi:hypothetical protein